MRATTMTTAALCALTAGLPAQDDRQAEMISKRAEKMQARFIQKADWILDYDEARAEAKKQGKMIFTYFTRSYAY